MANRYFNDVQALEKMMKFLYFLIAYVAEVVASGTLDLTADITISGVAGTGTSLNGSTITIVVNAAADNPTDTVIAVVTGTAAATIITITPNDGTNNSATPVPVTTAQLRELIATGDIAALNVTLTDAGSLLDSLTATGGGATELANGGEGDGEVATLTGGVDQDFTLTNAFGISDVEQITTGEYKITLEDKYVALRFFNALIVSSTARDFLIQIKEYDVNPTSGNPYITFRTLTGGTATQLNDGDQIMGHIALKNTSAV